MYQGQVHSYKHLKVTINVFLGLQTYERSLLNMHMTFDFEAGCLNRAWSTLVKWLSNHFLESCHIKKKAFYSSLGYSSISVQYSSPVVQSTDSTAAAMYQGQVLSYKHLGKHLDKGRFVLECLQVYHVQLTSFMIQDTLDSTLHLFGLAFSEKFWLPSKLFISGNWYWQASVGATQNWLVLLKFSEVDFLC